MEQGGATRNCGAHWYENWYVKRDSVVEQVKSIIDDEIPRSRNNFMERMCAMPDNEN